MRAVLAAVSIAVAETVVAIEAVVFAAAVQRFAVAAASD